MRSLDHNGKRGRNELRPHTKSLGLSAGLFMVLLLVTTLRALAEDPEESARRIAKQLRCPICESVSVADSPAELAGQMRAAILKKIQNGESEQQIIDYFVSAYGDSVLLEPPRRGLGWMVWIGPLAALAFGGVVLWTALRGWVRTGRSRLAAGELQNGASHTSELERERDPYALRAQQELDAVRGGPRR